jgi:Putative zinc-finger
MTSHADSALLAAYAAGDVDPAHAFSVEAHLARCESCRAALAPRADAARLERLWLEVEDRLDEPARGPIESLLRRLGVADHVARLLAATPSLTLSWLSAIALALGFGVFAAHHGSRGVLLFLCLAGLAPMAGVAAAFGPALDPTYELGLAAPLSSVRLLLVRSSAVLATTIPLAGVAALALPGVGWTAAAWLVPSLALTLASLALATFVAPVTAVATVGGLWVAGAIVAAAAPVDRLAAFDGAGQLAFAALAVVAAAVLLGRRDRLDSVRVL